jgi:hypothetical protein
MPNPIEAIKEVVQFQESFAKAEGQELPQAKITPGYTGKDYLFQDGSYDLNKKGQLQSLNKDVTKMRWGMAKSYALHTVDRQVVAASDGNAANVRDYEWLEILNPHHRFADLTKALLPFYEANTDAAHQEKISYFFWWITMMCQYVPQTIREVLRSSNPPEQWPLIENFIEGGVAYLSKGQRKEYLLKFVGGRLVQGKEPFDTRRNSTFHSGAGWAIYVVSLKGQWYAGSHKAANFHHSSFLGGRNVLAAGEIQARNGTPTLLSAKSGHYTPSMSQFLNGVASLKNAGVDLSQTNLLLFAKDKNVKEKEAKVKALAALTDAQLESKYSVWDIG